MDFKPVPRSWRTGPPNSGKTRCYRIARPIVGDAGRPYVGALGGKLPRRSTAPLSFLKPIGALGPARNEQGPDFTYRYAPRWPDWLTVRALARHRVVTVTDKRRLVRQLRTISVDAPNIAWCRMGDIRARTDGGPTRAPGCQLGSTKGTHVRHQRDRRGVNHFEPRIHRVWVACVTIRRSPWTVLVGPAKAWFARARTAH